MISKKELYLTTRTSFSTNDYMGDIIKATKKKGIDFQILPGIIGGIALSSIIIPQLPISSLLKNILGLFTLTAPFLILLTLILIPSLQTNIQQIISKRNTSNQQERIIYHEAGHVLAGYLCGLPIISYDITGEKDAGTMIDFSILTPATSISRNLITSSSTDNMSDLPFLGRTGHLLVVAMAGVVAETLRFGDSCGGLEDFPVALEVLRLSNVPLKDRDDTLRWGLLKALNLLRIYRDELDAVA
eukprot:CAMPEP_0182429522 /NCGR_PEP_ID=MMETSP1167-20130531/30055_1 /TAXON_ID=2988 /ORGANISM="Mallomonas Sp, Strain CCMP3275" /LENGTH=243 /DNA_ID=CAMNT_0024613301 /DNA_START=355 /DNA_END=1082 /DNA_ORIENTATION=+